MPTSIEMPYNQIVRSYINMYTQKRRGLVENMLGMSLYYMPIFEQALEKEGLPLELKYLPVIESALNPDAVSRAGATGLWQFMLPTARGLGLDVSTLVDERRDPYRSSECAAKYLKQLYGIFNDWSLAIAAYNCGAGNVNKALVRAGEGGKKDFWAIYHYLPAETCGYVPAFIAANYVMTYFNEHGISPALAKKPIITDSIHVTKRVHFKQIADVLDMPIEELRILNPQYRQDVIPGDIHPYSLVLPSKQVYCYIMSEDSIVNHDAELYAQRTVVEPSATGSDSGNGEYTTNLVVKYHKVRQGETLNSIANKYGVTIASIKKANNLSSNKIKRGKTLKINTYQKVYVKNETAPQASAENPAQSQASSAESDSTAVEAAGTESVAAASATNSTASAKQKSSSSKSQASSGSSTSKKKSSSNSGTVHTVKKGESLSRIARKYPGVSANDILKANNLESSKIIPGQKLKIPSK